jgi:hypothetical protein
VHNPIKLSAPILQSIITSPSDYHQLHLQREAQSSTKLPRASLQFTITAAIPTPASKSWQQLFLIPITDSNHPDQQSKINSSNPNQQPMASEFKHTPLTREAAPLPPQLALAMSPSSSTRSHLLLRSA